MNNMNRHISHILDKGLDISFIIPFYKGKKFIPHIVNMLNNINTNSENSLELVVINDFNGEDIAEEDFKGLSEEIRLTILENEKNKGIYQSRVLGVKNSSGRFVVMLDQDDEISSNYIKYQMGEIGDKDAVVCNGINFNKPIYRDYADQLKLNRQESYELKNPIVSPGQAVIKKEAIPEIWLNNSLIMDGADDYFLWILMLHCGCSFAINERILYLHRITGNNTSLRSDQMRLSVCAMADKLVLMGVWSVKIAESCKKSFLPIVDPDILKKRQFTHFLIKEWLYLRLINQSIAAFFEKRGIKQIGLYGKGVLGDFFVLEMEETDIDICFYIDKKRDSNCKLPYCRIEDDIPYVDIIVVCVSYDYESIENTLIKSGVKSKIISICEIIAGMNTKLE